VKYAKLARSQISATVSGYNCGNANVLRVAAGDFSWSAALFPPTYPRSPLHHEFCRLFSPSSELPACHCGLFVCLTCARVRISCAWAAPKEGGWAFEKGFSRGAFLEGDEPEQDQPQSSVCVCVCLCACLRACLCGLPACPHDNLLCMKSAVAAAAAAGCLILRSSHFCLLVQRFLRNLPKPCQARSRYAEQLGATRRKPANRTSGSSRSDYDFEFESDHNCSCTARKCSVFLHKEKLFVQKYP